MRIVNRPAPVGPTPQRSSASSHGSAELLGLRPRSFRAGQRPARRCGWILALTALLGAPAGASAGEPPAQAIQAEDQLRDGDIHGAESRYHELLGAVLELAPGERDEQLPEVLLALLRLEELLTRTGNYGRFEASLERWGSLTTGSPGLASVAARARLLLGFARVETTGSRQEGDRLWSPLGFLEEWRVIGPFDNERGGGFLTAYGPEKELDLGATYDGKRREVSWRGLPARGLAGVVNLAALFEPNEEVLAYALTFVRAEAARDAALRFGTDEGYRIWVNGLLVSSEDLQRRFHRDQSSVGIRLEKGWNSILFKVPQTQGAWRLAARLTTPEGWPLEGVREGFPADGEDLPASREEAPEVVVAPDLKATLEARVATSPADARAWYLLGCLHQEQRAHDRNDHPDTEAFLRAVELDSDSPVYLLGLARSYLRETLIEAEKDENQWRQTIAQAASHGSAVAEYRLAKYYADTFHNWTRARRHLAAALERNPFFEAAILLVGEVEAALRFPRARERALEVVGELPRRTTDVMLRRAGEFASRGDKQSAETLLREVLARNARKGPARAQLADLLLEKGKAGEALELLRAGAELAPFSLSWHQSAARLLEGTDRLPEAIEEVDACIRIRPEANDLHQKRARLLLRSGRNDDALAALDRALELQPNLPEVREYVEFLRATKSSFEEQFRRDTSELIRETLAAEDPNPTGDPARILLDLTAVEVNRDGTTKEFFQRVFRVLNDRGIRAYDDFASYYAAGEQVLEFKKARVYHPDGSTEDARLSRFGGGNDGGFRRAGVDLPPLSVGDVVEVEFIREDIKQSFFGDYFGRREIFQANVPMDEKVLLLRVPVERDFYFHQRNLTLEAEREESEDGKKVTYTWVEKDIPKLDPEPAMPSPREVSRVLEISTFESWDTFNSWYWNLIRKQFETSPEITRKVGELTSGADSDLARIRAIYNFVVSDIRYNAWEFGVHGFKPYNAATIFARRFGDCKDKATLMTVMLAEAGIRALPVLIYADTTRDDEDLTLPMVDHFNHCISFVPATGAVPELFLDGTAQFHSIDELPSMDRGAKVLLVSEEGGAIRQIPWNDPSGLSHSEEATVLLEEDLGARLRVRARCKGEYASAVRRGFEIEAQRKTDLEKVYGRRFAGATVTDVSFSDLLNLDENVNFSVEVSVPRFLEEAPEGLAVPTPRDFFGTGGTLANIGSLEERTRDVVLGSPRQSSLRTVYVLPEGFRVKSLPPDHDIQNRFGRLQVTHTFDEESRRLVVERLLALTAPRVPVADYPLFREFAASVNRLGDERILLEKS